MQRQNVHDIPVSFRVSSIIVEAAAKKAEAEGMSFSELVRHALRKEVVVGRSHEV